MRETLALTTEDVTSAINVNKKFHSRSLKHRQIRVLVTHCIYWTPSVIDLCFTL